jgi:hypothetical protein
LVDGLVAGDDVGVAGASGPSCGLLHAGLAFTSPEG